MCDHLLPLTLWIIFARSELFISVRRWQQPEPEFQSEMVTGAAVESKAREKPFGKKNPLVITWADTVVENNCSCTHAKKKEKKEWGLVCLVPGRTPEHVALKILLASIALLSELRAALTEVLGEDGGGGLQVKVVARAKKQAWGGFRDTHPWGPRVSKEIKKEEEEKKNRPTRFGSKSEILTHVTYDCCFRGLREIYFVVIQSFQSPHNRPFIWMKLTEFWLCNFIWQSGLLKFQSAML